MLRVSEDLVDRGALERWARRLDVEAEWDKAQGFVDS